MSELKTKTNYPKLRLGEVHYLDFEDLTALKEIEKALAEQLEAGETIDSLLSDLFFKYLQKVEYKEEEAIPIEIIEEKRSEAEITKPPPSKIKIILEEIRKGVDKVGPKAYGK